MHTNKNGGFLKVFISLGGLGVNYGKFNMGKFNLINCYVGLLPSVLKKAGLLNSLARILLLMELALHMIYFNLRR